MANHSNTLACKIPLQRSPVGHSSWGCKESDITDHTHIYIHEALSIDLIALFLKSILHVCVCVILFLVGLILTIKVVGQNSGYKTV